MTSKVAWLFSPVSIAIVLMHWFVVVYAVYGEHHTEPFHFIYEPLLTQVLLLLNMVPMVFGGMLYKTALAIGGDNLVSNIIGGAAIVLAVSFQWLLIGSGVSEVVRSLAASR